jgi:hypothetical protein
MCQEEIFRNVYFAANSLYYVESGSALLRTNKNEIKIKKGEIALIRQHSKLGVQGALPNHYVRFLRASD